MSNEAQKSPEEIIAEGGKALEDALLAELSPADATPAARPQVDEDEGGSADDTAESDESQEAESQEDEGEGDEKHEDGGEREKPAEEGQKPKKGSKGVEKLLHQRNSARAERDAERQKREAAEAELAALKAKQQDGSSSEDDDGKDEQDDSIEAIVEKVVEKRLSESKAKGQKAALDQQEREALMAKFKSEPLSKEELEDMDAIIGENPKLSDEAALRIVSPHRFVGEKKDRSDAAHRSSGGSPSPRLREDIDPKNLKPDEQRSYLEREFAAGRLQI